MVRFLVTRLAGMVGVLFLVVLFTYAIFFALAPDPAVQICGKNCTPELIDQIRTNLGLDRPFYEQFLGFLSGLFVGTTYGTGANAIDCAAPCLGYSFQTGQPVLEMFEQRFGVSATLAVGAAVLWLLMGVSGGMIAAIKKGTWFDRAATGAALGGVSIPNYVLALVLQYVLVVRLGWLPFPQAVPFAADPGQWFLNFVMPWLVLAFTYASMYQRLTRANVLDTLDENFVRTARAKGLAPRLVWRRHALRPALTPVVTLFGMDFAGLLGGAIIIETVFGLNGIGKMASDSITKNDQPVIMGVTLVAAFLVIVGNVIVDIVYTTIDPRVRVGARA